MFPLSAVRHHSTPTSLLIQLKLILICILFLRFGAKAHPNLLSAVSLSEKNRHIVMVRMAGDLNDLLGNPKLMRRMPKARLMR